MNKITSHNINDSDKKTVVILGLGYVGLTLLTVMADVGFETIGIDKDPTVIGLLKNNEPHFHEKGLAELLGKSCFRCRLSSW